MMEFTAAKSAFNRAITLDSGASSAWFGLESLRSIKVEADGGSLPQRIRIQPGRRHFLLNHCKRS